MAQTIPSRRPRTAPRTALLAALLLVATCAFAQRQRRPDAGVIDYALGQRYERENNFFFAEEAYEKSGYAGYAKAYIALAHLYESGRAGVIKGPNDTAQAYYEEAAALGDDEARAKVEEYSRMPAVPKQFDLKSLRTSDPMILLRLPAAQIVGEPQASATNPVGKRGTLGERGVETYRAVPPKPVNPPAPPIRPITRPIAPSFRLPSLANDRVRLLPPSGNAVLAEEFALHLFGRGTELKQIVISQRFPAPDNFDRIYQGEQTVKVIALSPDEALVKFVPYALGSIKVNLLGFFPDHAILNQDLLIQVDPPSAGPTRIYFPYFVESQFIGDQIGVGQLDLTKDT